MTFPRGEQAGKAASFWGETSLCLFSSFRAWPRAVEMGPLSSEGLWRPRLLISRFSSFKGPISFQQGEFICKAPRRSRRQIPAQLAFRGRGFMAGPVPGATPSFVCRFVTAGLREPRIHSSVFRCDVGQVQVISCSGDNGLLCPSVTIYSGCCREDSGPSPILQQEKVRSQHSRCCHWRDQGRAFCLTTYYSHCNSKI